MSKRLVTTVAKAKALRSYVEPVITCSTSNFLSKLDTSSDKKLTHPYRKAFRYLGSKLAVKELFSQVGPKVGDRKGGYTRIIKLANRLGDGAPTCMIELVDYNEIYHPSKEITLRSGTSSTPDANRKPSRRGSRGKKRVGK